MKKKYNYIIILIILLLFALFCSCQYNINENFSVDKSSEKPISLSDLYTIINDCIDNIYIHDTTLKSFDNSYNINKITIDKKNFPIENIKKIFHVLKIQDNEIGKLLNTYVPNSDLDGLIDDTLLDSLKSELYEKSNYSDNPFDCDPNNIKTAISKYEALLKEARKNGAKEDGVEISTYSSMATMLKIKLADLESYKNAPGNTKCLPPLKKDDANNLLNGFYAKYMVKILKSQDVAIQTIKKKFINKLVETYSGSIK